MSNYTMGYITLTAEQKKKDTIDKKALLKQRIISLSKAPNITYRNTRYE